MKIKILAFIPVLSWFLITTVLLVIPGSDLPKDPFLEAIYFDKWVHIGLFGLLTVFGCYPFLQYKNSKNIFIRMTIAVIVYGIVMEFIQKYCTHGRSFDITDIIADAVGAILGYLFITYLTKKKPL